MNHIHYLIIGVFLISCGTEPKTEKTDFFGESDKILLETEDIVPNTDAGTSLQIKKFENSPFEWILKERTQQNGVLVTDIALEALVNDPNKTDTVYFFTARGKWEILDHPEEMFEDFPKDVERTIYSELESCFFSIRQNNDATYQVLFGGIENAKAYAVIEQGHIRVEKSHIAYEIFLPEEVETYIDYGLDL